jgi:hypothetical protein
VQIAIAGDAGLQQRPHIALVVVLAQHHHTGLWSVTFDHLRRVDALGGVSRRHLDVHEHDVRREPPRLRQHGVVIGGLADDINPGHL